ncbi:MAG: aldehyde dehydrogenase family protein [Sphaerochaetaceae bacterium]|nr:aldehyde dehydrogenase family protein [Sphaerochaetaceae bacterium]
MKNEDVNELIRRSRSALKQIENYNQKQVDTLVSAIGWAGVQKENMERIARKGMDETRLGTFEGKYNKMSFKIRGIMRDMKGAKTVGIIEEDEAKGLVKIAKPLGVIGALVPCTNPCVTPFLKAMWAIKSRNSIIFSPHPRSKETNTMVCTLIQDVLEQYGAPRDLVLFIENPSVPMSSELMSCCDTVIATGGSAMVKAAYSSGTPAYGVGVGNAMVIVDETADYAQYAAEIGIGQQNDNSTGCSTENGIIVHNSIYENMVAALEQEGAYIVSDEEKKKLEQTLWVNGILNRNIVGQSAATIADMAGIADGKNPKFLVVPENDCSVQSKFTTEKLSPVLTIYSYENFDDAIKMLNDIQSRCGAGHSCGIYSTDEERIMKVAMQTRTSRVMVRQSTGLGNAGSWENGMPVTATLGCGSWGGNSISENVNHRFFYNVTWVSKKIKKEIVPDEVLFADSLEK